MSSEKEKEKWSHNFRLHSLHLNPSQRMFSFVLSKKWTKPKWCRSNTKADLERTGHRKVDAYFSFQNVSQQQQQRCAVTMHARPQDLAYGWQWITQRQQWLASPHSEHKTLIALVHHRLQWKPGRWASARWTSCAEYRWLQHVELITCKRLQSTAKPSSAAVD